MAKTSTKNSNSSATVGFEADIGKEQADTFAPQHPELRADYVLANPSFNDSDWFRKDDDVRCSPASRPRAMERIVARKIYSEPLTC